jgi:hypothetical protein
MPPLMAMQGFSAEYTGGGSTGRNDAEAEDPLPLYRVRS